MARRHLSCRLIAPLRVMVSSEVPVFVKESLTGFRKGLVPLEPGDFTMSVRLKGSIEPGSGTDRAAQREGTEQL